MAVLGQKKTIDLRLWTGLGLLLLWMLHHFYGFFGHYGFDDIMGYGFYGQKWAEGQLFYLNEDFFSYRWGFISLTGLSYALFGVNDHSSALVAALVYALTLWLIARLLRRDIPIVGAVAMLLYGLDHWTLYYADKLMPDTTVAFCVLLAFALIGRQRYRVNQPLYHALGLVGVLLVGYLTKQSILLLTPAFGYLFLSDVLGGKQKRFWGYVTAGCILVGLGYLGLIGYLTGDPLMRFEVVNKGLEDNLGAGRSFAFCNYAIQPWSELLYRIGPQMPLQFLGTGMALSLGLAVPAVLSRWGRELLLPQNDASYWGTVFVLAVLSTNFMTTSYQSYLPICPDIRHFLLLVPIAVVVAAPLLVRFAQSKTSPYLFVGITGLMAGISIWQLSGNMRWLYFALVVLVFGRLVLPLKEWASMVLGMGFVLVLLTPVVSMIQAGHESDYLEQRAIIYRYFYDNETPSAVVSSVVQKHTGQYLLGYDHQAPTQFYDYSQLDQIDPQHALYVLTSGDMRFRSRLNYDNLPSAIRDCYQTACPSALDTVYFSDKMVLYRISDKTVLQGM